jgi:hypothetical protein
MPSQSPTTCVMMNAYIKSECCTGMSHFRRGFDLPRWQYEPFIFCDGRTIQSVDKHGAGKYGFLESPHSSLEQGTPALRMLELTITVRN